MYNNNQMEMTDTKVYQTNVHSGIPQSTLLMWGQEKNPRKQKPRKSRLLSNTKGEKNRIDF